MKKTLSLSLLVATILTSAHAKNQFTLETINVVSAHGTSVAKKDVTDSVTIITKEELEESRITNLFEALSKLGNIAGTQNGGLGQQSSMFVRGMNTHNVLILIDGVRYNDVTGTAGAAQFDQIMLFNVEQIEVIKGAQSGVWGADASAGVINIITSKAKKGLHAAAKVEYGAYETKTTALQASYGAEYFDIVLGGSVVSTDGFSASEPAKDTLGYGKKQKDLALEKDNYRNKSFNTKLGINITENDRFEFGTQIIDSKVNFDSSGGAFGDSSIPNTELKNRFYTAAYKHKDSINDINLQYSRSTFKRTTELVGWGANPIDTYNYQGSVQEVKLDDKISYLENSFLRVGASYQKFDDKENEKNYNAKSLFATNYNKLNLVGENATIFTESLRFDRYSEFKNALTGKLGLKQFVHNDIYVAINGGTGYNAPSLYQLSNRDISSANLKPEKSRTFDITLGNDVVWATAFRNEVRDAIDWVGSGYVQMDGKQIFKGFELGYKDIFFNQVGLEGLYTYVDTKDQNGKTLPRRPKQQLDAKAIWYIMDNFDIGANAQYIGKRHDVKGYPPVQGAQTGRYIVAGAVANYKAHEYISIYAKADNLTNKHYQTVDGYATAGRSFYVGMTAKY
ncbi:MAG: TonB-dependent receptor [Sulfurimonadaceae bacterium]|jgi:vitamin B12 transporter|nr:TonB-dependent receptor [Sulfurimonadaceae bacterium]